MQSFPIILNQSNAINSNTFVYNLQSNVDFSNIKIALSDISLYYSWYSITSAYNNNKFNIVFPNGTGNTTYNIIIPDGTYSASDLNNYLKYWFIQNNLYITNNTTGEITVYAQFEENAPAYALSFVTYPLPTSLPAGFSNAGITFPTVSRNPQIVINNQGFGDIIGFSLGTYPSAQTSTIITTNSTKVPQISPISSVIVLADSIQNIFANNSGVLHTFSSKGVQFGSLISSSPNEYNFVPCQQGMRQQITVRLVDNLFRPLQLLDTNLTIKLLLAVD